MKVSDEDKKMIVDNYIKYKLLMKEAKNSGIENSDDYKKQIEMAKEGIIFNMWQEAEFKKIEISDDEAQKYYNENGEKVWRKDIAPVAFPWWSRNPTHH